jgi:alpha-beta hydrolase superfamily lysophospholipase
MVAAYRDDPLVFRGMVTARLAAEMLRTMARVTGEAGRIGLPLLVMQGGADRLVDPEGAGVFYRAAGSADKTLKIYDGLYHEILNEPERMSVLHDLETWMEERML